MSEELSLGDLKKKIRELKQRLSESNSLIAQFENKDKNYKAIFNAANDAIVIHDLMDGSILDVNQKMLEMYGYSYEEALQLDLGSVSEGVPPYSQAEVVEFVKKAASGQSQLFEWKAKHKKGGHFWVEVNLKLVDLEGKERILAIVRDITERKNASDSLENERSFLSAVLDNIEEAIVICNAEGQLIKFNESARRLHGIPERPITPNEWSKHYDLYRVDGQTPLPVHEIPLFKALRGEKVVGAEIIVAPKNSKPRYMVCNGQALYDHRGGKIGAVIVMHDLTEQKKAEAALRESETKYRIIAENMADVITVMDMDLNFTYVSPSIVKLRGFTVEESMEQRIDQIMTPESFQRLSDVFNEESHLEQKGTADPDRGRTIELEEYKKDGSTIWVENTASFIRNNDQKPVGILVVSRDITERKHAEEALKNSEASLKEAQRLAVIGNWSLDLRTGELSMSDQMYSIIGLEKTPDALNVATHEKHYTPESWQRFRAAAETARQTGKPYEIELEIVRDGGSNHHAVARGEVLEDETGQAVALRGTLQDITDRVNLQAQLSQAQKMESVGRLAGGVAHDFNNMLSIILGNTEMAMEGMAPDDPLHDHFIEIFSAARRSADITRQLLAFARKQTIAPKVLDLNQTINSMLKMLRRLIGEDIDLAWLPGENIWPVRMDPSQIDQILANLCVNARDAIVDIGKITIETGTATFDSAYCVEHPGLVPGDFVLLAVSDDGIGMDQEAQANLFEPFFTTKTVEKGTGLGLATVYGIVKQNDGFINVYSEPDQGTTFRIYLPRYRAENESPTENASDKINLVGTETILLVEDEPSILRMTRMMLERTGYKVLAASTPGEAIALAREHAGQIHLLMTDVVMPEMNGRELARNLMSLYPDLKRLFMSGYTANVIAHHGVLDPGVHFIQKPFSIQDMSIKVREALGDSNNGDD